MTDDEINRRVAEIEGFVWTGAYWFQPSEEPEYDDLPPYATDWGWCGPLVEKYGLSLRVLERWDEENQETDTSWGVYGPRLRAVAEDASLTRAVCLAVISLA